MFSSSISIGDAIKAACKLKSDLKIARKDLEISDTKDTLSEELNNDFYPTSSECSLPISIQSMPPALTKFICWLIDEKSFLAVSNQNQTPIEKMRKCMSLTENIVSLSKNVITPFQIGLALQLYHEFGSKQLVDTLHVKIR